MAKIHFSDYFDISPEIIDGYGAFNVSLINDLPLFIDPFLLFNSKNDTYQTLHNQIIRYMKFLRDVSLNDDVPLPLMKGWFTFPEVKQNWFGLSKVGNDGRGLGNDFAVALHKNLKNAFSDFGNESVTRSSHIEKLCLLKDGVGRDNISDFTTNLIKKFLAEFTQNFALKHLKQNQRKCVALRKVIFNYDTRSWVSESFQLPYINNDYILLTPKDILTKDEEWINRPELIDRFPEIANALPDPVLRAQVNDYLLRTLPIGPRVKEKEKREAISRVIEHFPQVLDYYIRDKENSGEQAISYAEIKVRQVEDIFIEKVRSLVNQHLDPNGFYKLPYGTYEEAYQRLIFLKDVIENKGGHKIFYLSGKPVEREADLQVLYRLTWYATPSDITREANDGRGPADFKVSRGVSDKTIIEFKLAKNSQLERNLQNQCKVYELASDTTNPSIKAILYFDDSQYTRVSNILKKLNLVGNKNIVLIDACDYNKLSGSLA